MPLPPAPSKRAALLPAQAYDAPARSSHKAARKSEGASATGNPLPERPQVEDFAPHSGGAALAFEAKPEGLIEAPAPARAPAAGRRKAAAAAPTTEARPRKAKARS